MPNYCESAPGHPYHGPYHDDEYGFPTTDDRVLFERLVLEINQAGLSWLTVLKKRAAFGHAFDGFDPHTVAGYGDAAIENARRICALQAEHGSFAAWLDAAHPLSKDAWVALFRKTFLFTGGEITGEFLMSTGYLPGAHDPDCPVYGRIAGVNPPWMAEPLNPN